jgi:hypothetical protein
MCLSATIFQIFLDTIKNISFYYLLNYIYALSYLHILLHLFVKLQMPGSISVISSFTSSQVLIYSLKYNIFLLNYLYKDFLGDPFFDIFF